MSASLSPRSSSAFQQLTDENRGPLIVITTYIFFICSCLAAAVKLWTRLSTARSVALTDWLMLGCIALALAQTIALTVSVNHGLGRHQDDLTSENIEATSQAFYAANILTVAALATAKASVILLITSIQPLRPVLLGCYATLAVVAVWATVSVFALAFQCELPTPWALGPDTCVDQWALKVVLDLVNILTDLVIVLLAYLMMRTTQVSVSKRWAVVALFGLRLATPPFAICSLVSSTSFFATTNDRTWEATNPTIWTQIMLHISIITACIPSIKRFLADVQSGLMGATISEQYEMTHSGGKTTQLSGTGLGSKLTSRISMSKSQRSGGGSALRSQTEPKDRGSTFGNVAFAHHGRILEGEEGRDGAEESESVKGLTRNVILQKFDVDVQYEERGDQRSDLSDDEARRRES